jgi:FSR family fosmidomycin resistance protein-like MFS transporter
MTQLTTTQSTSAHSLAEGAIGSTESTQVFRTSKVVIIAVGHLTHDIFSASLAPLLPLIIQKLSLSLTLAGTLAAFQQLPSLIDPLLGVLADRGRLRWLVLLAPAITAAGMCLVGVAPNYTLLALLLLTVGISTAIWHTSTPALVARASARRVGQGMSFFMIGGSLGYTLGPLIAVAAVSWWGLEGIWRLFPIALVATALLFWQTRDLDGFQPNPKIVNGSWSDSWQVLKRVMLLVAGILITQGFLQVAFGTYLPTLLASQGASLWIAGASLSIFELAGVLGILLVGVLSDRLNRRKLLVSASLVLPFLVLAFLSAGGWFRIVILLAIGFSAISINPVLMALIQEYSHQRPATANGLYFATMFASRSLIIILVGVLADHFGLRLAFYGCAFLAFLALPFVWFLPEA